MKRDYETEMYREMHNDDGLRAPARVRICFPFSGGTTRHFAGLPPGARANIVATLLPTIPTSFWFSALLLRIHQHYSSMQPLSHATIHFRISKYPPCFGQIQPPVKQFVQVKVSEPRLTC